MSFTASPKRKRVDKRDSAKSFNKSADKTQAKNVAPPPMRGGWRL